MCVRLREREKDKMKCKGIYNDKIITYDACDLQHKQTRPYCVSGNDIRANQPNMNKPEYTSIFEEKEERHRSIDNCSFFFFLTERMARFKDISHGNQYASTQ